MKVIDLLNKIANGEEVPRKIKYNKKIYEWKEYDCGYQKKEKIDWIKEWGYVAEVNRTYFYLKHCFKNLNDEVEIIEEEKKIPEKLEYEVKFEKGELVINGFTFDYEQKLQIIITINEIIDYLKSKGE